MSCNSFYSSLGSVKSVEYLELIFISLGSPLAALEREILRQNKGCLMSEKTELNERVTTHPASKYVGRDVTLEAASCNADFSFTYLRYYLAKVVGI